MLLKFVGEDKSMGLRKGAVYPVKITSGAICDCINAQILDGKKWVNCPYESPQAFANNWVKAR